MPIDAILFDKDGVLIDFDRTWGQWGRRFIDALADGDEELSDRIADAMVFDRERAVFLPGSPIIAETAEAWMRLIAPVAYERTQDELVECAIATVKETTAVAAVDLHAVLGELRDLGLPLGIATNDTEKSARAQMKQLGALDYFDKIMGYDSGYGAKPAPGMQLAFAEHVGLAPDRIAMVGDSTHDLFAGGAAGMACVGVLTGPADETALEPHADVVLADISGLSNWIQTRR